MYLVVLHHSVHRKNLVLLLDTNTLDMETPGQLAMKLQEQDAKRAAGYSIVSARDGSLLKKLPAADGMRLRNRGWRSTYSPATSATTRMGVT